MAGRINIPRRAVALCACAALLAGLLAAGAPQARAASLGGGSSFSELTQGGTETTSTPTTATTGVHETESSSNSGTLIVLGIGAAVLLLAGIGFLIVRDARRVAPAGDAQLVEGRSAHDAAVRLRRRRAKAKAARRQRRRNR